MGSTSAAANGNGLDQLSSSSSSGDNGDKPYIIRSSPELGRYLVATRDIQPLEIIIKEKPIISGPSDNGLIRDSDPPKCLGCCAQLTREIQLNRCSKCYWPVCNDECAQLQNHAENECIFFSTHHIKYPPPYIKCVLNKCILILRMLLFKYGQHQQNQRKRNNSSSPSSLDTWNRIVDMESHYELRKTKPNAVASDEKILANFEWFNGGNWATASAETTDNPTDKNNNDRLRDGCFTKEEVRRLSGIIDTNAHILPQKISSETTCQIFPESSLLSHDCCPNAEWSLQHSDEITNCESLIYLITRATRLIPAGSVINVCYDDSEIMYGTLRRLIPLEIGGLFICKCKRCSDPSELGTNFSSVKCPACVTTKTGQTGVGYLTPIDPTSSFSDWNCDNCSFISSDEQILDLIQEMEEKVDFPHKVLLKNSGEPSSSSSSQGLSAKAKKKWRSSNENIRRLESFLKHCSGRLLHPNHFILQEVRLRIIAEESAMLEKLSGKRLQEFVDKCEHVLKIADVLSPGLTEYRTVVEFHLARGLLMMQQLREQSSSSQSSSVPGAAAADKIQSKSSLEDVVQVYQRIRDLQEETLAYFRVGNNKWSSVLEQDLEFVKNYLSKC